MPAAEPPSLSAPTLSDRAFARFCRFITTELGIKTSDAKRPMLQSRLQRRFRELGLPSFDAYCDHIFSSAGAAEELVHFIDAVTTNKTDFFREPQHFRHLAQEELPALDPGGAGETPPQPWRFKLWCAGCSTGEESYTLAMVLAEFALQRPGFDFSIFASDVSSRVLTHAGRAIYEAAQIEPVPPALRSRHLLRSKDHEHPQVRVGPELRSRVSFHRINFMAGRYDAPERVEVIFFRNVMIYFDRPTQEAVINKLCRHLAPGGYLYVGHSESLAGLDIPVEPLGAAIYQKRKSE